MAQTTIDTLSTAIATKSSLNDRIQAAQQISGYDSRVKALVNIRSEINALPDDERVAAYESLSSESVQALNEAGAAANALVTDGVVEFV